MAAHPAVASPPWTEAALCAYLESLGYRQVRSLRQVDLAVSGRTALKAFGFGRPVLLEFESGGRLHQVVLHTLSGDQFGHDRPSDRAESLLLAHRTFNRLPHHVASLDVGAFTEDGMISLGRAGEFFLLTEFAHGELYAKDLQRIRDSGQATATDEQRVRRLALYLAGIHRTKRRDEAAYHRRIRDLIGHGEGLMGLADSYPDDFPLLPPGFLRDVERSAIDWRWRLRSRTDRLSQVHGDFHPFNILFGMDGGFRLLDRSRGEWGEPADDLTALSINYLFFALQAGGGFSGPLRTLFDLFWDTYLKETGDRESLEAAPPFLAWRGLVVASPIWYPDLPDEVRRVLFRFIENVLADERFRPDGIDRYLREGPWCR